MQYSGWAIGRMGSRADQHYQINGLLNDLARKEKSLKLQRIIFTKNDSLLKSHPWWEPLYINTVIPVIEIVVHRW